MKNKVRKIPLIHHQGTTCRVACVRSSLGGMAYMPLVVTSWRLASDTLMVARDVPFFLLL
ncbi:MAG: hypothetical protein GY729_07400 [Desulfobacteraceae bacterium]|nr:hypothetical protein [Desulfobacteraceae bacterium]